MLLELINSFDFSKSSSLVGEASIT